MDTKKPIIIANWKMKLGLAQSQELAGAIKKKVAKDSEVVICPSFPCLLEVGKILKGSNIKLGAQDCFWEAEGAYTGEVSAGQLRETGCDFVILGHSERRKYLQETDEIVHRKIRIALASGLTPIVCVGETFEQRQQGAQDYVLIRQTTRAFEGIDIGKKEIIIAYEPVWVIGTGQAISPAEAGSAHQVIRQTLFDIFPPDLVRNNFRIVYGGSVDHSNVSAFVNLENTSGVLVGGASLNTEEFISLINNSY
ncbi:MAG: triose-phosphate isomerase [Patescibacteria group bacterium]|jgi:triosephosphate isomerase